MPEVVTNTVIDAPDTEVWSALTDLEAYPNWNPVFREVAGQLRRDEPLAITRVNPDGSQTVDRPTVTMYRPGREIRWRIRYLAPGLLDSERGLKLERLDADQTRFVHWERRSGLFAYLSVGPFDAELRDQFELMNLALKRHIELGHREHRLSATATPAAHAEPARQPVAAHA